MINHLFYDKYIKYKNKYLELTYKYKDETTLEESLINYTKAMLGVLAGKNKYY